MNKSGSWGTDLSKDGNTRSRVPGGMTESPRKETKHTHTLSSMTSKLTKTRQRQATRHVISLMKVSVPISVSISDALNPEPECICSKDPEELIRLFYQSLVQRSLLIRGDVEERYMPPDLEGLPKEQQNLINQWC